MSKNKGKILIVDDNKELLSALGMFLKQHFKEVRTEKNPNLIPSLVSENNYDIILLDMNFKAGVSTGNEGIYWMHEILKIDSNATIVFITAYGDVDLAVKSMKEGATDFIQKSWDEDKILSTLNSAYKLHQSKLEINKLKNTQKHLTEELDKKNEICICESKSMQKIYDLIEKVAKTDANVLITGENGTGKEIIARLIHNKSNRKEELFLKVDLGALQENLFESELFGHEKGAFTDAKTEKEGRFELASGGTLFLDEIGNLPVNLQPKLLSVIQNKEVTRLGSTNITPVDIRLISATNQPLFDMIEEKSFREDLLYRINTIQIDLPPLRERTEDIETFARFFLQQYCHKYGKDISLDQPTVEKMKTYPWPGNIRELQHSIEKAVILSNWKSLDSELLFPKHSTTKINQKETFNLEENEKQVIQKAIDKFNGNISLAAEKLGINRSTLYAKIRKYEL
jgi:DNA-binding NtrC family response regulator